jgi:sporulation protein YlmC with PRC-barrel domain
MARDHDRLTRNDAAGVGPEPGRVERLHRLSESHHYRIAGGEPDIRGWEVRTLSGSHLGEVEDLLIDPHRGEVVMLDVDLNDSPDRINLPIRGVQLDRSRRCVIVDSGDIREAQTQVGHNHMHDDHPRHDTDDRLRDSRQRGELLDNSERERDVRYGTTRDQAVDEGVVEETVIERRPVIEEVVVRRRVVDDPNEIS